MTDKHLSSLLTNEGIEGVKKYYKEQLTSYCIWTFLIGLVIGSFMATL